MQDYWNRSRIGFCNRACFRVRNRLRRGGEQINILAGLHPAVSGHLTPSGWAMDFFRAKMPRLGRSV